jgi:hypothetical protein
MFLFSQTFLLLVERYGVQINLKLKAHSKHFILKNEQYKLIHLG